MKTPVEVPASASASDAPRQPCRHRPKPLYDPPKALASALLRPHRSYDWMACEHCGSVGLKSRRSTRIDWKPPGTHDSVVASAAHYNAWNDSMAEQEK